MDIPRHGFRVVGHRAGTRRLVDHAAAFHAHAECDPRAAIDRESYLSHFTYSAAFREHLERERSERGYSGLCGASVLWFDLDRPDDLEAALRNSRRLCGAILDRYRELDDDVLLIFLSGSKGVHIGLPTSPWRPDPSPAFHDTAKRFALAHAERAGIAIDPTIYSKTRLFRAPNSRHPKTGLHKRRLSLDELTYLKPEAIIRMAERPEPFEIPNPTATSPTAAADWLEAARSIERHIVKRRAYIGGEPKLSAFTRRFFRDGELDVDRRAVSTFRVAAELGELYGAHGFATLVHALITEAALDSGLTPGETQRQIDCGLAYAERQREGCAS